MTFQTTAPMRRLNLSASNRSAGEVVHTHLQGGWLDMNPPYQRGEVWTNAQAIGLIRSLAIGLPIPALVLNDRNTPAWRDANGALPGRDEPTYGVVDGKQRITTLNRWYTSDLAVPASWFPSEDAVTTTDTTDGPYVTYDGLTAPCQRDMRFNWTIPMVESKVGTIAEEADIYLLLNGAGTPQSDEDLLRAFTHSTEGEM